MMDKELLEIFTQESLELVTQLDVILEDYEKNQTDHSILEKFGQIIDRIMGTAKTMGIDEIATFCELGKTIGYKAGQVSDPQLLSVVVAVLFDTTFLLRKMIDQVTDSQHNLLASISTQAFVSRLKWLSNKFTHIERSSVKIESEEDRIKMTQSNIDDLMKNLGL